MHQHLRFLRAVDPSALPGLQALLDAWEYARDIHMDPWQFAVEIQSLREAGVSNSALRWLIGRSMVLHGVETTGKSARARRFRGTPSLSISERDCFVLTAAGYKLLAQPTAAATSHPASEPSDSSLQPSRAAENHAVQGPATTAASDNSRPTWDCRLRELRVGRKLVKRFKHPASAQEVILSAFQEEGWPAAIDDPLPGQSDVNPKRRLHYTVRNLNRAQKPRSIRFYINGNGQLVRWELVLDQRATSAQATRN